MDSKKSTIGTEKPADFPSEPKRDNNHDMPKNSAPAFQQMKMTKPGIESARKDANALNKESTTSRDTTPSPQKPNTNVGNPGHKKSDSDSSNTSTKVAHSVSDRGDESNDERTTRCYRPSATEKKSDMSGIGGVFSPRTPPRVGA